MKQRLMDTYTDEQFAEIVANSCSYADCLRNLGYQSNSGDSTNLLKEKINKLGISVEHFTSVIPIKRTEENVFCEHSTANQSTLRRFYKKYNPPTHCMICGQNTIWNNQTLTLILDHINGTNDDDRIENLRWICPNCNSQLDTTNARNPHHKKYYCIDCGKQISNGCTYCMECSQKHQRIVERPDRETLKLLIRTTPFTTIAKQYGNVSDNAVRKWCIAVGLPTKQKEIKSYSDEEWALI